MLLPPIHRSSFNLDPPPARWLGLDRHIVQVDIAPDIAQKLTWLAERWSVPCPGLVTDILTAELCGRYLMTQVAAHCIDPGQGGWTSNDSMQTLRLPEPLAEALNQRAYEGRVPAGEMARRLIRAHLLGRFNPQMTSTGTMDVEGNGLRENKADIKVRLPESLAKKVQALADLHDLSKSDVMRNCLMLEAYGRIRYEQWTLEGHWC